MLILSYLFFKMFYSLANFEMSGLENATAYLAVDFSDLSCVTVLGPLQEAGPSFPHPHCRACSSECVEFWEDTLETLIKLFWHAYHPCLNLKILCSRAGSVFYTWLLFFKVESLVGV
jgi:hypothetical protein